MAKGITEISNEELERLENHVKESLKRTGLPESITKGDVITYMAYFLHDNKLAPSDGTMAMIYRATRWCMDVML